MTPEEIAKCEEAKRVGRSHGWDHANYEAAYGKEPKAPPGTPGPMSRTMPYTYRMMQYLNGKATGGGTYATAHHYKLGWKAGVAQYKRENPSG